MYVRIYEKGSQRVWDKIEGVTINKDNNIISIHSLDYEKPQEIKDGWVETYNSITDKKIDFFEVSIKKGE